MMDKTPRSLLKGASSLLTVGKSLTSSGIRAEHESELDAKEAMKGFVQTVEMTENNVLTLERIGENNVGHVITGESKEKEKALNNPDKSLSNFNTESKMKLFQPPVKSVMKSARQKQHWSLFIMFLVTLNTLLFMGILITLFCFILAVNLLPNQGNFTYHGTADFISDVIAVIQQFLGIIKDCVHKYFFEQFKYMVN